MVECAHKIKWYFNVIYVTLDHKTSHKGTFFEIEIYTSFESWINKLSIDVFHWFVRIGLYLAEIQLFENLESEGAKKSKYWENNVVQYNVLLAIATNIPVLLMTGFVVQGHKLYKLWGQ